MAQPAPAVRLRQAVLVAEDLEAAADALRGALGLGEPFRDPGVGEFGLANCVFAIGDCFLEIVSPLRPGTAAGRQLDRAGADGGYMVLFDLEDLDGARERAERAGVRTVWRIDLPDISGTHMHPADLRGAIVSLDRSRPYGTWRWGGPAWTGTTGTGAAGRLDGITLAVADPQGTASRWGEVLGVSVRCDEPGRAVVPMSDGALVAFVEAPEGTPDQLAEITLAVPAQVRGTRRTVDFGAARLTLAEL